MVSYDSSLYLPTCWFIVYTGRPVALINENQGLFREYSTDGPGLKAKTEWITQFGIRKVITLEHYYMDPSTYDWKAEVSNLVRCHLHRSSILSSLLFVFMLWLAYSMLLDGYLSTWVLCPSLWPVTRASKWRRLCDFALGNLEFWLCDQIIWGQRAAIMIGCAGLMGRLRQLQWSILVLLLISCLIFWSRIADCDPYLVVFFLLTCME